MADQSQEPVDILIVGFGAVGALYGWVLENSGKARVTAVARSNFEAVSQKGITIASTKFGTHHWKPYRVLPSCAAAADREYFAIVCTFKHLPDLSPTQTILGPVLDHSKCIVLLQNGIGIEDDLQHVIPETTIISGAIWIGANLKEDGTRVEHGSLEKLELGIYKGELRGGNASSSLSKVPADEQERVFRRFVDILLAGGAQVVALEDIQPARWIKNLWNATFSTLSTLSGLPTSQVMSSSSLPYILPVARRTMLEILYTARAMGMGEDVLPAAVVDAQLSLTLAQYGPAEYADSERAQESEAGQASRAQFRPSMLLDFEARRPMELQCIVGSVIQRAREFGVETPRLDMAFAVLSLAQQRFVEEARQARLRRGSRGVLANPLGPLKGMLPTGKPVRLAGRD